MSTLSVDTIQGKTTAGTVAMPAGMIMQLVTNTYSTPVAFSDGGAYADSGLTCQITPKFSTSKIFITVSQHFKLHHATADAGVGWKIFRDSTNVKSSAVNYAHYIYQEGSDAVDFRGWQNWNYLDSPSTTNQITYKTQISKYGGGTAIAQDNNNSSTMTLMELKQ